MSTINTVMSYFKGALESGIDANGAVASGTPTYGGTDTGEDFDGFNVYVVGMNDTIDFGSIELPALLITFDLFASSDAVFGDEPLGISISITPVVNDFYGSASDGGTYSNKEAINIYIDRLYEFIKFVQFPDVKLIGRDNTSPITPGSMSPNNDFYIAGMVTLNIEFMEEF